MDIQALDDDDLEALRADIVTEQDQRRTHAQIPNLVRALTKQYEDSGGDRAVLINAVTDE